MSSKSKIVFILLTLALLPANLLILRTLCGGLPVSPPGTAEAERFFARVWAELPVRRFDNAFAVVQSRDQLEFFTPEAFLLLSRGPGGERSLQAAAGKGTFDICLLKEGIMIVRNGTVYMDWNKDMVPDIRLDTKGGRAVFYRNAWRPCRKLDVKKRSALSENGKAYVWSRTEKRWVEKGTEPAR